MKTKRWTAVERASLYTLRIAVDLSAVNDSLFYERFLSWANTIAKPLPDDFCNHWKSSEIASTNYGFSVFLKGVRDTIRLLHVAQISRERCLITNIFPSMPSLFQFCLVIKGNWMRLDNGRRLTANKIHFQSPSNHKTSPVALIHRISLMRKYVLISYAAFLTATMRKQNQRGKKTATRILTTQATNRSRR